MTKSCDHTFVYVQLSETAQVPTENRSIQQSVNSTRKEIWISNGLALSDNNGPVMLYHRAWRYIWVLFLRPSFWRVFPAWWITTMKHTGQITRKLENWANVDQSIAKRHHFENSKSCVWRTVKACLGRLSYETRISNFWLAETLTIVKTI